MRSFLSLLLAGLVTCLAIFILSPGAFAQSGLYALEITLEENGEVFSAPKIVVEPGKTYAVELNAGAAYDFKLDIPANTRAAAKEQFDRDLGRWASDFLLVNTELAFRDRVGKKDVSEYGKAVTSSLLLRVAEPAREIRSNVPVSDRDLKTKSGQSVETLSITIKGSAFTP